jgi:protein-S-isoprenylcysteine O-methyltransferase Ste14
MRRAVAAVGSAVFFVVGPGIVVGLIPWLLTGWQVREPAPYWAPMRVLGVILLVAGLIVLVQAFVRFVVEGFGTPAPVAAPDRLVVGGLYRYVRNPMYVAIIAAIVGQALLWGQLGLLLYAAAVWTISAVFVRWYEEPTLTRRFGAEYEAYRRAVPAWWPRLRPWKPSERDEPGACGVTAANDFGKRHVRCPRS